MLEGIISEAKTMEADAIKAETDAQKAYETFVKDTNGSIEEKNRDITNKSAMGWLAVGVLIDLAAPGPRSMHPGVSAPD